MWKRWDETCTAADERAFKKESIVDEHFGFPYEWVYSKTLNDLGRVNVYENREGKTRPPRPHYLSNLLGIRLVKQQHSDARIWDERYEFNFRIKHGNAPYDSFREAFGEDGVREVDAIARKRGIETGPHGEFKGKPDMAVFYPVEDIWRFIEVKHDRPGKKEPWRPYQKDWLRLLAEYLVHHPA